MQFKLLFLLLIANTYSPIINAQFVEVPKNEWHFGLYADYFFKQDLDKFSEGKTDVQLLQTAGYRMSFGYRRYIAGGFFVEADLNYARRWVAYRASYDSLWFENINGDTLQYFKPLVARKYEREAVALTVSTGVRSHLFKGVDGHLKGGIRLSYFLQSQSENRGYGYSIKHGNTGIWQSYMGSTIKLPGGKEKLLGGRSYIMPMLELETGFSINPEKWKGRALHLKLAFICSCLTEEGDGSMKFYYYNINQDLIGTTDYQLRWKSLSIGLGLSF